jgi:hypothetical protein
MFVRWLLIDVEHWLFIRPFTRLGWYRPSGSGNAGHRTTGRLDTLLGPEETGVSSVTSDCGTCSRITVTVVRFWLARLFFENCTVDASISDER